MGRKVLALECTRRFQRMLCSQNGSSRVRHPALAVAMPGSWISPGQDVELWREMTLAIGDYVLGVERKARGGQWFDAGFMTVSDDHPLWWLNEGAGASHDWEFKVHICGGWEGVRTSTLTSSGSSPSWISCIKRLHGTGTVVERATWRKK